MYFCRWLIALVLGVCFVVNTSAQLWNDLDSGSVGFLGRNKNTRERVNVQRVPDSYDIVDTASAQYRGASAKNCTGSGCCIPKCFAQKGDRGLPGE
jgi:collagen type IV alpha